MPQSIPRKPLTRRSALRATLAATAALALPALAQSDALRGPVRIIVPLTAGGAGDVSTRALAIELEKSIGQPVIVDNRPGGLFQIGLNALQSAPADGLTLLHLHNSLPSVQVVQKLFDLNRQTQPVALTMESPMVLLVPGNSPHKTLADLVAFGRANPGKLSYSTLGPGSVEHLKSAQIERAAGFSAVNVPYKAGPDMVKGLLSGEVDFTLTAAIFARTFAPKGQVRVLAVVDRERWKDMPEVPTIGEAGVSVPQLRFWGGYAAHADTPPALVQRLHGELSAAATRPSVVERIYQGGMTAQVSASPAAFREFIGAELKWMADVAATLQLKS